MDTENLRNSSDTAEEISMKDLFLKVRQWYRYLLSKWIMIVAFGILGSVLGVVYALLKKPIYLATTTFVLEEGGSSSGSLGGLGGLASMAGIELGGGGGLFQGDNILELYKSRTMIEKTLFTQVTDGGKTDLLINFYIEFNKLREDWTDKPLLKTFKFTSLDETSENLRVKEQRLRDSIIGTIVNDIKINCLSVTKPDKKLSIIRADTKNNNEFFAKTFNDEIVKNVNDFYIQTKTKKSLENVNILQRKTDSVRSVMNGAIYSAAAVADATPNLNPTRQIQRQAPVQRSQFSAETNKAVLSELVKNLEMSKMTLLKEAPLIQVIDQPVYPLTKEKFGKVKGIFLGGICFSLLAIIILVLKRVSQVISAN